jgi:hypothetical protein
MLIALASHLCGPWFESRTGGHMWVELFVGSLPCFEGFSPGSPVFPPSAKIKFQLGFSGRRATLWKCHCKLYLFIYYYYLLYLPPCLLAYLSPCLLPVAYLALPCLLPVAICLFAWLFPSMLAYICLLASLPPCFLLFLKIKIPIKLPVSSDVCKFSVLPELLLRTKPFICEAFRWNDNWIQKIRSRKHVFYMGIL